MHGDWPRRPAGRLRANGHELLPFPRLVNKISFLFLAELNNPSMNPSARVICPRFQENWITFGSTNDIPSQKCPLRPIPNNGDAMFDGCKILWAYLASGHLNVRPTSSFKKSDSHPGGVDYQEIGQPCVSEC